MAEVFAGFVIGYALALAAAPAGALALVRSNERTGFAQRVAPPGTNVIALSVVLHVAAVLVFTAVGLIFGMMLGGLNDRRAGDGLGSPNFIYTLIVIASAAVITIPLLAVPALRMVAVIVAVAFAVLFGWALPWLAEAG
jgi:hypothetical protein